MESPKLTSDADRMDEHAAYWLPPHSPVHSADAPPFPSRSKRAPASGGFVTGKKNISGELKSF